MMGEERWWLQRGLTTRNEVTVTRREVTHCADRVRFVQVKKAVVPASHSCEYVLENKDVDTHGLLLDVDDFLQAANFSFHAVNALNKNENFLPWPVGA